MTASAQHHRDKPGPQDAVPVGRAAPSWVAATWTVPVVPGVAATTVARVGLGVGQAPPLLLLVTVLLVVAAAGVTAIVLASGRYARGVGVGLVAGALVSVVAGLVVLR